MNGTQIQCLIDSINELNEINIYSVDRVQLIIEK